MNDDEGFVFFQPDDESDRHVIAEGSACPSCAERRADALVWREDDSGVDCLTCGNFYHPE